MKISELIKNLQSLPEPKRKIILWIIVIVVGLVFFSWWLQNIQKKLKSFPKEEFIKELKLPEMPKIEIPKIEMPEISEEELKKSEEILKEKNSENQE